MPFDPARKLANLQAIREKPKKIKRRPRRRQAISQAEKLIVAEIVNDAPGKQPSAQEIADVAIALRRSPETIKNIVVQARESLQGRSQFYVDVHRAAVEGALAAGDYDVARKGATEMIEKISARDADGKVERIVEKVEAESTTPRVQIGIMLGGLRDK